MTVRKLTSLGDFSFGNSQLDFLSDSPETVAQVVQTACLLWYGEWYLDTEAGLPYVQGVLGKHNQETADITVQDYILGIQGVTGIASFESIDQQDIRKYTAEVVVNTLYGETPVQVANSTLF